jgi:hypothetical protein
MKIALGTVLFTWLLMVQSADACLRPTVDDRAVQWSTSIVIAKLSKIEAPVQLTGSVQERRGNMGILGTAETVYLQRVYQFTVEKTLDGHAKPGDSISVLRVTTKTTEPLNSCGQHLTAEGVGHSFLLLLRPFAAFTLALPNVITRPTDPSLQCIIHMEEVSALKPEDLAAIENTIGSVHAAADQFDPKVAERLLTKIANTKPETAGPSVRAFEKFGLKAIPSLNAAIAREQVGALSHTRLSTVKSEMEPPITLFGMIQPEPEEGTDAKGRRR